MLDSRFWAIDDVISCFQKKNTKFLVKKTIYYLTTKGEPKKLSRIPYPVSRIPYPVSSILNLIKRTEINNNE